MQTRLTVSSIRALAVGLLLFGAASARGQMFVFDFSTSDHSWIPDVQGGSGDINSPIGPFQWGTPSGGGGNAWFTDGVNNLTTGNWSIKTLTSPAMTVLNDGSVGVTLTHRFKFEVDLDEGLFNDGGQLRYRVNQGVWTLAIGFSGVGYNATQIEAFDLAGESDVDGWGGTSFRFGSGNLVTSTVMIPGLTAGSLLELELRGAWNSSISASGPDWVIKQVEVTNVVPEPRVYGVACAVGLLGYGLWRRVRRDRPSPKARSTRPTATP
jgi:hypothetical protein